MTTTASPGTRAGTVGPGPGRRPRVRTELLAGALAAAVAMGAYCLAMALRGTYPFGGRSRAVNDLGNQFVPFHAHLWDLQHGVAHGDLLFNWSSGYGVPFLADFFSYLANPFSWIVGLFPRDAVDLPVFLVTLLSIGLGTGLMTHYLGRLRPGSPWLRALLAVGFGLCGWALNDASTDPMWTWGLVSVPLLGIAVDWCLQGRRWVLGTLLVALCWFGNFYTAAMATLAAGLVLVVRLVLADLDRRQRIAVLLRAGSMVGTALLLVAPVLLVSLKASKAAQPMPPVTHLSIPPVLDILTQLLPASRVNAGSVPFCATGMLGLLLVLAFPFNRSVPGRERLAWCLLLVLTGLSFLWKPTVLLWQGGAMPNGSPFRDTFVLCAMLVMVAWLSLTRLPGTRALLGAAGLVGLLCGLAEIANRTHPANLPTSTLRYTWLCVLLAGGPALLGLLALRRTAGRRTATRVVGAVLAAATLAGGTIAVYGVDTLRNQLAFFTPHQTMDPQTEAAYRAVQADAGGQRSDTGPHAFADNDPLLLNSSGSGAYYSSYLPAATTSALARQGIGYYIAGRHTLDPSDPVSRALMGVTGYLQADTGANGFRAQHAAAAPLVTVHPEPALGSRAADVFALQQDLLGAKVWQTPELRQTGGPAAKPLHSATGAPAGWELPAHSDGDPALGFTARCTPGSQVFLNAPWLFGTVDYAGQLQRILGSWPISRWPLTLLGTVPANGRVDFEIASSLHRAYPVPAAAIGCLDTGRLADAVARLRATGAQQVALGGHGFHATLPAGSTGTAVMATADLTGWTCSVDGAARRAPVSYDGLLGVRLKPGARNVDCSFTPPGLRSGLLGTGAGAAALAAVAAGAWFRRRDPARWRRRPAPTNP